MNRLWYIPVRYIIQYYYKFKLKCYKKGQLQRCNACEKRYTEDSVVFSPTMTALPLAAGAVISSLAVGRILAPSKHDPSVMPKYPPPVVGGRGDSVKEGEQGFKSGSEGSNSVDNIDSQLGGELDVRRMAQIVWAKPTDHAGEVVILPQADFDLDKTIFGSMTSPLLRTVQKSKVGVTLFWSDSAVARIREAFSQVPPAPRYDQALVEFIQNDCDFAVEHADGSFMDHLRFCYEYSHVHYPQRSPRVLLLHSIMGVGTNFFPMPAEKIPDLRALLTEFEFEQIALFPTMLRVFYHGPLRWRLEAMSKDDLCNIEQVVMYRVIDNARMVFSAEAFWAQLNYQLIHLLDFLPASSWKLHAGDNFLDAFKALYGILRKAGKLQCRVDFDATEGKDSHDGQPLTLAGFIRGAMPSAIQLALARRQIAQFSKAIDHSLEYELISKGPKSSL